MEEVRRWLAEFGNHSYWVGARDMVTDNQIRWLQTAESVGQAFWMDGEPDHFLGDCAYLDINKGLLGLYYCDTSKPSLCQLE